MSENEVEDEEDDEDEYEEDEDLDEIYAESRFPAGFLPMRMCRWFPSGNCRQGWGCMFRSLGERAAPLGWWSRAVTTFYGPLYLAVTCSILFLPEEYLVMDFSASALQECFRGYMFGVSL